MSTRRLLGRFGSPTLFMVALQLCSCSGRDAVVTGRDDAAVGHDGIDASQHDAAASQLMLSYLSMTIGGGECGAGDCWQRLGVRDPDTLVMEDAVGTLEFAIQAEEFEHITSLARSPEVNQTVADSLAGTDCGGFDIGISMDYQWENQAAISVPFVDNCATREGYVPRDILQYLSSALRQKYLACPPRVEPPGWNINTDPLPQRALCWYCYDMC